MPSPLTGAGPDPRRIERPWIGSYPPGVPPTYRYPDVVATRFLDDAVRDFPDVTAVDAPHGADLAYSELQDAVDRFATALEALGVGHGVALGVSAPLGPTVVVAAFAAWRLGAIVVPIGGEHADDELRRRLAVAGCRVLVADLDGAERAGRLRSVLPALHQVVVTTDEDWQPRWRRLWGRLRPDHGARRRTQRDDPLWLGDVLRTVPSRMPQKHVDVDDDALVCFDQDGVALAFSHRQVVAAAFQSRLWVPDVQAGRERVLVTLPVDHPQSLVAGVLDPVLSASTIVVSSSREAAAVASRVDRAAPTLLRGPSDLYAGLLASDGDLTSLRACVATDGPLAADDVAAFADRSRGARLRRAYGAVASLGLSHANPVYGRAAAAAIGLPVSDTTACIVDPEDRERVLPAGEAGRLLVRGPQVTLVDRRSDAAQPGGTDGWLDTGDTAVVDVDGWFSVVPDHAPGARAGVDARLDGGILASGPGPLRAAGEDQP